jgi:hypothetical protein
LLELLELLLLELHLLERRREAHVFLLGLLRHDEHELLLKHLLLRMRRGGLRRWDVELVLQLLELLLLQLLHGLHPCHGSLLRQHTPPSSSPPATLPNELHNSLHYSLHYWLHY